MGVKAFLWVFSYSVTIYDYIVEGLVSSLPWQIEEYRMTQTTDLSQDSESGHWLTHLMEPTYPNIKVLKNSTSSGGSLWLWLTLWNIL